MTTDPTNRRAPGAPEGIGSRRGIVRLCAPLTIGLLLTLPACDGLGPENAPEITILEATHDPGRVSGSTRNAEPGTMSVVLWAKTDRWYVQPLTASPFTEIREDGTWENWTHPWARMVALLVDETYEPDSPRSSHPADEDGVLAFDEDPESSLDRVFAFSDYQWRVKQAEEFRAGPGPNFFSDDPENVWTDDQGLHLKITSRDGQWYAAEVILEEPLGYGTYTFQLDSPVDDLDPRAVFAGFVYESNSREIDIEFSQGLARPDNAQFVVQPYTVPGNIERFTMTDAATSSHRFTWSAEAIEFTSWAGHASEPPATPIHSWTYTGDDIPPPGDALMRFNLWLISGSAPQTGVGDEVVIRRFEYQPNR